MTCCLDGCPPRCPTHPHRLFWRSADDEILCGICHVVAEREEIERERIDDEPDGDVAMRIIVDKCARSRWHKGKCKPCKVCRVKL